jgi:hypothetical protein
MKKDLTDDQKKAQTVRAIQNLADAAVTWHRARSAKPGTKLAAKLPGREDRLSRCVERIIECGW